MRLSVKGTARTAGGLVAALLVFASAARGAASTIPDQIDALSKGMREVLDQDRPEWTNDQRAAYEGACRDALDKYLTEPLSPDDLAAVRDGQRDWLRYCLPPTMENEQMEWHLNALGFAVSEMVGRPQVLPTESERKKMDQQIYFFCDRLRAGLPLYFSKHTTEAAMTKVVHDIRECLKATSRNPWFPALKQPLDSKEMSKVRKSIIHQTLATQLRSLRQWEVEHGKLTFDLGVTSAWSATTKFVSKTIEPPPGQMLMFTHSHVGAPLGMQVRPPMMPPGAEE